MIYIQCFFTSDFFALGFEAAAPGGLGAPEGTQTDDDAAAPPSARDTSHLSAGWAEAMRDCNSLFRFAGSENTEQFIVKFDHTQGTQLKARNIVNAVQLFLSQLVPFVSTRRLR